MVKFYIGNAFSLNMLNRKGFNLAIRPISVEAAQNLCRNEKPESVIGHAETAAVVSTMLEYECSANRVSLNLDSEWSLIVAQYTGPRLSEGATTLPEGAKIEFWQVYPI